MTEANQSAPETHAGQTAATPDATASDNGQAEAIKRAEAIADRLALKAGVAATVVGEGLKRFFARVVEEAEDVWAEAQHIRKNNTKP